MTAGQDSTRRTPVDRFTLAASWPERAAKLERLMGRLAAARARAAEDYATAWLAAEGTDKRREQTARLATVDAQLAADDARAELEAYRLVLDAAAREGDTPR